MATTTTPTSQVSVYAGHAGTTSKTLDIVRSTVNQECDTMIEQVYAKLGKDMSSAEFKNLRREFKKDDADKKDKKYKIVQDQVTYFEELNKIEAKYKSSKDDTDVVKQKNVANREKELAKLNKKYANYYDLHELESTHKSVSNSNKFVFGILTDTLIKAILTQAKEVCDNNTDNNKLGNIKPETVLEALHHANFHYRNLFVGVTEVPENILNKEKDSYYSQFESAVKTHYSNLFPSTKDTPKEDKPPTLAAPSKAFISELMHQMLVRIGEQMRVLIRHNVVKVKSLTKQQFLCAIETLFVANGVECGELMETLSQLDDKYKLKETTTSE